MAWDDEGDSTRVQAPGPVWFWRVGIPLIIGSVGVAGLAVIVFQEQRLLGIAGLLGVVSGGSWWCWRLAFALTVTNRAVHWRGALRGGSVPLADVVAIEPSPLHQVVAIRSRQGRLLVFPAMSGLLDAISRMRQLSPTIALRLPPAWLRRLERL
jgi:hypothetical protein